MDADDDSLGILLTVFPLFGMFSELLRNMSNFVAHSPKVPSKLIHSLFGISEQVFSYLTSF